MMKSSVAYIFRKNYNIFYGEMTNYNSHLLTQYPPYIQKQAASKDYANDY